MNQYILRNEGCDAIITADSMEDAVIAAHKWEREGDYDTEDGTIWVDTSIIPMVDGKEDYDNAERITTSIDPKEPFCIEGKHDWQSPYEIFGGCKENPGVRGNGGGVIIQEICPHCGWKRETNTWAQRRDTGQQGLQSVRYIPESYIKRINKR